MEKGTHTRLGYKQYNCEKLDGIFRRYRRDDICLSNGRYENSGRYVRNYTKSRHSRY